MRKNEISENNQQPTTNIQNTVRPRHIGCSVLDVGCWLFSVPAFHLNARRPDHS
jgi:hypothetical protein